MATGSLVLFSAEAWRQVHQAMYITQRWKYQVMTRLCETTIINKTYSLPIHSSRIIYNGGSSANQLPGMRWKCLRTCAAELHISIWKLALNQGVGIVDEAIEVGVIWYLGIRGSVQWILPLWGWNFPLRGFFIYRSWLFMFSHPQILLSCRI